MAFSIDIASFAAKLQTYKTEGQKAYNNGKLSEADEAFSLAISTYEEFAKTLPSQARHSLILDIVAALYSNRALIATDKLDFKKAMNDADKTVELKKDWFRGYQRRAQVYAAMFTPQGFQQPDILEAIHSNINKAWQLIEKAPATSVSPRDRREVEQLRTKYLALQLSVSQHDPLIQEFLQWTRIQKVETFGIEIRSIDKEYRAVHATSDLRKGKRIATIPKDALISLEIALEECKAAAHLKKEAKVQSQQTYLACYLLEQRTLGSKSRWHPYIQLIPQDFSSMPCTYDEKMLKELQQSSLVALSQTRKQMIEMDYKLISEHCPDFAKIYSLQDFFWARMVVLTRVFSITVDSTCLPKHITEVLVPIADMLNHKQKSSTDWKFNEKLQAFTVVTTDDIAAGEQVYDSYGRKCNTVLANGYGFALENNPDNTCMLVIHKQAYFLSANHLHESTLLAMSRLRHLFHDFQLSLDKNPIVLPETKEPLSEQERKAAFQTAQTERFKAFVAPDHSDEVKAQAFDKKTEHYMIAAIAEIAKLRMKEFATTLQEDEKMWADHKSGINKLSPAMVVCLLVRRGEKLVLQHYVDLLSQVQYLLQLRNLADKDSQAKATLKKFWLTHRKKARDHPASDYLVSIWEKL